MLQVFFSLLPFFLLFFLLSGCVTMPHLPDYVIINDPHCANKDVLRTPAEALSFPLSEQDRAIIETLERKYDQEENCAGLAAPQIGFNKRAIVFAVLDDLQLKKWRPDLTDTMPKTIWINPSYEPVNQEKHVDYEGCFSVNGVAGPVERYKTIRYTALTPEGQEVQGIANGFLARLIQHEIDHLNGTLFIDLVPQEKLLSIEAYREKRAKALDQGRG
jgi:peptide deformylase